MTAIQPAPDPMIEARRAYEDSAEPLTAIEARLRLVPRSLRRIADQRGWNMRPPQSKEERTAKLRAALAASQLRRAAEKCSGISDRLGLVERLRGVVEREIAGVEKQLTGPKRGAAGAGIEKTARTLASLVRTLRELRALEAESDGAPDESEDIPRDADELRRALAERLDRLARERHE